MAVGVAYQNYSLTLEGNLEASYPEFDGTVTHIYNKTDFCLIYLQVGSWRLLTLPTSSSSHPSFLGELHRTAGG